MVGNGVPKGNPASWPFTNPWPPLLAGLGLLILALIVPETWKFWTALMGLLCVGSAISLRLSFAAWELEDRAVSAGIVALGGLGALVGYYAFAPLFDSLALALGVAVGVSLGGALLILLPPLVRRLTITVLVLVHFGGIVCAVVSVAPPNGSPPFLVSAAWTYFYRHYLQFAYLNNAYHFYSPDPGPPSLLWFAIKYEKGHGRWVMMPDRGSNRTRQDYQRYLALGEYCNQVNPVLPPPVIFNQMWENRVKAGHNINVPTPPEEVVPRNLQYRLLLPFSQHVVAAYARHVAVFYPSDAGPEDRVVSVKVYRVAHIILSPSEMARGRDPMGRDTYSPFFLGEFNGEGTMISKLPRIDRGQFQSGDPFLYWAISMGWKQKPGVRPAELMAPPSSRTHYVIDYTDEHAGFTKEASEKVYGPSALPTGQPAEASNP
jgi:hypothetical protein